jgi:hypothetical protein
MDVVVAVLGGYLLGGRRTQFERLYEQRAEVIAELTRRLGRVQRRRDRSKRSIHF